MRLVACLMFLAMTAAVYGQTTQPDQTSQADTTTPTTAPSQPPSADQLLNQMLHSASDDHSNALTPNYSGSTPAAAPSEATGSDVVAAGSGSDATIREGTDIVDRMGRMRKSSDSPDEEFVFESDGRALRDPPLILLPNLELMLMERAVNAASHDLRFRITGTVTEYHGRNYVLLEKFVVIQDRTQQF